MKGNFRYQLLLVCSLVLLVGGMTAGYALAEGAVLTNDDCVKCHEKEPADIAAAGAKHQTAVTCQDCHIGHP